MIQGVAALRERDSKVEYRTKSPGYEKLYTEK